MAAGAWVVAAVTAAGVAWTAVAFVGHQVTENAPAPLSQEAVARAIAAATTPTASATAPPQRFPDTGTPTTAQAQQTQTQGTNAPGTGSASPGTKARKPASGNRGGASAPPPDTRTRPSTVTLMVLGGTVAVRCSESGNGLLYATPANGWRVRVGSVGPILVDVTFTRDGQPPSHVSAKCGNVVVSHESDGGERDD
jgi:hypothetical protein